MIKTVLFDLDGTLLPMNNAVFARAYFKGLGEVGRKLGYDAERFSDAVEEGLKAMVKNTGTRSNETVFWEYFGTEFGTERRIETERAFDEYYRTDFQNLKECCSPTPRAKEAVITVRNAGKTAVLATNPVFPEIGIDSRIRWAGLTPELFSIRTSYETIGYCKPNPAYYRVLAHRTGCDPEECLMIGNDTQDDLAAKKIGMQVFLLTDCLIHENGEDCSGVPQGDYDALLRYLREIL